MEIDIGNLIDGLKSGAYIKCVGSQFGSIWSFDGLVVVEASPEQYAAFNSAGKVKLGHGTPVLWLGHTWRSILVYRKGELVQVNIHTDADDSITQAVCAFLTKQLGESKAVQAERDVANSVWRRDAWEGPGGSVHLVATASFVQVSLAPHGVGQEKDGIC